MVTKIVTLEVPVSYQVHVMQQKKPKTSPVFQILRFIVVTALAAFLLVVLSNNTSSTTSADHKYQKTISAEPTIYVSLLETSTMQTVDLEPGELFPFRSIDEIAFEVGNVVIVPEEEAPWIPEGYGNCAEFTVTAYCPCEKCCGSWALNREGPVVGAACVPLVPGVSVAVESSIFPLGTTFVDADGNQYIAHDTGSGVVGFWVDIFCETHEEAVSIGMQHRTLYW